jgi:hypothetical protein
MEEDLKSWIHRISENRPELGGMAVCPFAKKYKTQYVPGSEIGHLPYGYIVEYMNKNGHKEHEITVFINKLKNLSNEECIDLVNRLNEKFPNYIFLKDHPDDPGFINGINTGNQKYPIILAQPKSSLIEAREALKKTKYYDYWTEEYKNEIWKYGSE